MAPTVLPGIAQQMQQPQAQTEQPGLLSGLFGGSTTGGGMTPQQQMLLSLGAGMLANSRKRPGEAFGAAVPQAMQQQMLAQKLFSEDEEKKRKEKQMQAMSQWYSQPKFLEQFGSEFGKLANEYPQFAHEVYTDTLRPQGSRTGAVDNWNEYNRIKETLGEDAANQFKDEFVSSRKNGKVFSGVQWGMDENNNIVTGAMDDSGVIQYRDKNQQPVKGPVTPIDPATMAAEREQKKLDAKKIAGKPKAKLSRDTAIDNLNELGSRAKEIMNHPGLDRATGLFSAFPSIPGGDAADVEAKLNTLKTQVFIGVIGAMREASQTGGAVGQVTEREMAKLEGAWASLQQSQGTPAFKDELRKLITRVELSMQRINEAYQESYGGTSSDQAETNQTSGDVQQADPLGIRE